MPSGLLNPYRHRTSLIHRWPAWVKLAGALSFVLAVVLLPSGWELGYGWAGTFLAGITLLSRVPLSHLLKRLLMVEPFALGVALLSLWQPHGGRIFLLMLAKSTLCLWCMVLLACTTRFSDALRVLWRLRLPTLLVTTLALMHRYLFLIFEEMGRMRRARKSRSLVSGRWWQWGLSANLAAHLFLRTSERAERVYSAMCARGWKT